MGSLNQVFLIIFVVVSTYSYGISEVPLDNNNIILTPDNATSLCQRLVHKFGNFVGDYLACSITYARPIRLCLKCVNFYIEFIESYNALTAASDEFGPCISQFFNQDRIMVVQKSYQHISDLWSEARCGTCFQVVNGSITANLTEGTSKFFLKVDDLTKCFANSSMEPFDKMSNSSKNASCDTCREDYYEVNLIYENLLKNNGNPMCIDIMDSMNITRQLWNNYCGTVAPHDLPVLLMTGGVIIITCLYYICNGVIGAKRDNRLRKKNHSSYVSVSNSFSYSHQSS